ncbi:MAG TPA: RNase A-like domain-containing protein [Myxococcaceae bacterium]
MIWLAALWLAAGPAPAEVLDPGLEFEPGIAKGIGSLEAARADLRWVERDVRGYELSDAAPWTFSLYYGDGSRLVIPLSRIWFGESSGPSAMCFRRHKATGRLVPFVVSLGERDPALAALPHEEAVVRLGIPRFDTRLTPLVTRELNETQIIFAAEGIFTALKWQAMNPVLVGPPVTAPAAAVRRTIVAEATAPASRLVPGGGLEAHQALGGHLLRRHVGLTQEQLAERIVREGIRNASSFSSRTVAERAAAEAIDANQVVISTWLKSTRGKLELDYVAQSPVGQVVREGAVGAIETCKLRLVLLKANAELGWYILTGFPML